MCRNSDNTKTNFLVVHVVFPTTDVCSVRLGWANKQKNGRPFFQISAPVPGKTEGSGGMRAGIKPHSPSATPLAGLRAASGRVWRGPAFSAGEGLYFLRGGPAGRRGARLREAGLGKAALRSLEFLSGLLARELGFAGRAWAARWPRRGGWLGPGRCMRGRPGAVTGRRGCCIARRLRGGPGRTLRVNPLRAV